MKFSSKMLQNLLYFMYKETYIVFSCFNSSNFFFALINALVYVNIDQGIHKWKSKVAQNEKRKKKYFGFLIQILKYFARPYVEHKPLISEEWLSTKEYAFSKVYVHRIWPSLCLQKCHFERADELYDK